MTFLTPGICLLKVSNNLLGQQILIFLELKDESSYYVGRRYLYSLKEVSGKPLWMTRRKTFIIGFATAIKSIIWISRNLFVNNFKYVLTYKFSQDSIELLFGHIRGTYGCNNNPNCLQFRYAIRSLLLHNSIKTSSGNCTLLIPSNDSLFSLKWKYKSTGEQQDTVITIDDIFSS